MERKIEFLYAAINDAQELIRFIDTKTAIVIGVIGAFIVGLFSCFGNIVLYACSLSILTWLLLALVIVFLFISIWIILKIIKPINNPKDNILMDNMDDLPINFFISSNNYSNALYLFFNLKGSKLSEGLKIYIERLKNITDEDIVNVLTFELFKVSYIRNLKNDRFTVLVWIVLILTILFIIFYGMYSFEIRNLTV